MSFANPEVFFILLALPLVLRIRASGLRFWRRSPGGGGAAAWGFANFPAARMTGAGLRARLAWLPTWLFILGFIAVVAAAARPQTEDWEEMASKGLDIMLCLDMSSSMNAVDVSDEELVALHQQGEEPRNRFDAARETLREFIKSRRGDRVGLVVFSSDAYLKFPTTLDYQVALDQINGLVLDNGIRMPGQRGCNNGCTIEGGSTAIGDALSRAYKRIEDSEAEGKIIILITDGNDNASHLKPLDVAKEIGKLPDETRPRVYAFLIGSGTNTKEPVVMDNGQVARRNGLIMYTDGRTHVDEDKIRELADAAGGVFQVSYDEEEFQKKFSELTRSEWQEQRKTWYREEFLPFLLAGLGALLLGFLLQTTVFRRFP